MLRAIDEHTHTAKVEPSRGHICPGKADESMRTYQLVQEKQVCSHVYLSLFYLLTQKYQFSTEKLNAGQGILHEINEVREMREK
jgi:hypothetical protein